MRLSFLYCIVTADQIIFRQTLRSTINVYFLLKASKEKFQHSAKKLDHCRLCLALNALERGLGKLKVWSTLLLLQICYFAEGFMCSALHVLYVNLKKLQHVFQCGIIQLKAPREMMGCLKSVAPKHAQVECGEVISWHSVVLENFLQIVPESKTINS